MKFYPLFRDVYGQLRGYRRGSIRRAVAQAAKLSARELSERVQRLRAARYQYAIGHFPGYADLVRAHTGQSDVSSVPFELLPILRKSDITQILSSPPTPLASDKHNSRGAKPIPHATGGSTGQPFRFQITRESYEWRTAVSDRGYGWACAEEGRRSFYVWGTAIHKPGWRQRCKEGIHHWLQNRKYFDSFQFDDMCKAACCRQINRFRPVSLVGYAGNLVALAQYVDRHPGVLRWKACTAVAAAEGLRPGMRALIEEHLADEVYMSYGSREFMLIGMEGPDHDGYYIAADNLYVEVVDDNGIPLPPGALGRIVITDLHNDATPFVRYEIGDLGRMGSDGRGVLGMESNESTVHPPPSTLHGFPRLTAVEGRLQEVIVKGDGQEMTALFLPHLMKEFDWVDGYQVLQEAPGRITLHLVTRDDRWQQKVCEIASPLKARLGERMQISFQRVDGLQKTLSGKTPIVVGAQQTDTGGL